MGQKATQAFSDPETRHHGLSKANDIEPPAIEVWEIEEICASAHFYEAIEGLRKPEAN
jgi:hypothetical protein